jgi:hypothetical protein
MIGARESRTIPPDDDHPCEPEMAMTNHLHRKHREAPAAMQEPNRHWHAAYAAAYEAAQPDAEGTVVRVELELRESHWEFRPGRAASRA